MAEQPNTLLHGTLHASIFSATPFSPSFPFNCIFGSDNPAYVTIKLDQTKLAETSHERDRVWNQTFRILCAHSASSTITITLRTGLTILGRIHIPASQIVNGQPHYDGSFSLLSEKGKPNQKLKLGFSLRFEHVESDLYWDRGIKDGKFKGLPSSSFKQHSKCRVVFYQDAHHTLGFQPPMYRATKLWEDVYKAIDGAKHFVYIAGWSLNPKMVLVRDPHTDILDSTGVPIGELLKRKAEEGVVVRIMLWNDETSLPLIKNKGLMRTHDEDAFVYFKRTKVVCKLCPRLHHKFPAIFAHHQKTITVDASRNILTCSHAVNGDNTKREILSFIGGLDLCDGRYDTEEHSLFRTLNTESHAHDFYQTNITNAALHKGGPREPWHDTHACVTGLAALDIMANFEQRWVKQCDPSLLLSPETISDVIHHTSSVSGDWNVQVFRSIDRISANFSPDNAPMECSVHEAYVAAIRRAKRFIYIENQYFIGGCHLWEKEVNCGCKNLIPIEIALKVVSKIRAGERFSVYIVMPMWPEGVPESDSVQDILHWTRLTVKMMYRIIGEALGETCYGDVHPRDYLNFFCLANREEGTREEFIPPASPDHSSHYWHAQRNRRFMVYVHSKIMIVDDEYILIGSANINQRSMDGRRDTEIAMGCYQPKHVGNKSNKGDVHAYRMSLWYEHTGHVEDLFLEPHSVDCVRRMREIGEEMWLAYTRKEVVDMGGVHLLNYPMTITKDGSVEDLEEGGGIFPDTTTHIKGRRSKIIPPILTT